MTTTWDTVLYLGDIWQRDGLSFDARRDAIVQRIKVAKWYDARNYDLYDTVEWLSASRVELDFAQFWRRFQLWADANRIYVQTWELS